MKKSDLKQGMVVELENGDFYLYLEALHAFDKEEAFLCGLDRGWTSMSYYDEEMATSGALSINKVFSGPQAYSLFGSTDKGKLLWERTKEKTHEIDGKEFSESTIKAALKAYVN